MTGAPRALAALLLLVPVVAGCAGPTVTDDAVRTQAVLSAEAAASELGTVELAVRTQLAGRAWWSFTDVTVTASESAAGTIEESFTSRQPPSTSGPLYRRTGDVLGKAADLTTDVRIAVRRHDEAELHRLVRQVAPVLDALDRIARAAG
jgi:hypothetical protein